MTRTQELFLHVSVFVVGITGVVFAWMKYFMKSDDPFAVANHPWQPYMLDLHVVFAPFLVFGLGWIFQVHIWPMFRSNTRVRRRSGVLALLVIAPMILSGYVLQVLTNETGRKGSAIAHWVTSALFVLAYLVHQFSKGRKRRNGSA